MFGLLTSVYNYGKLFFHLYQIKKELPNVSIKNIDTLFPIKIPDEKNTYTQKEIHKISKKLKLDTMIIKNISNINKLLMKNSNKYILITGSLYLIGKIRKNYL